jgi:hypothetical protein
VVVNLASVAAGNPVSAVVVNPPLAVADNQTPSSAVVDSLASPSAAAGSPD